MAAYAALVSLMHIIDQIQHHPRPPISLDKQQVESLTEKVTCLQEFLERYSHVGYSKEADPLESRIADAACAAEDIIESHIVDQILAGSTSHSVKISSNELYEGLQKLIEDMDSIKKDVMEMKEKRRAEVQMLRRSRPAGSLGFSSTGQITMVGFDDISLKIMNMLTGGRLDHEIIPIVGMGGSGKTTLARNLYQNKNVVQHFGIRSWVSISQEYKIREILLELLPEDKEFLSQMTESELGHKLHRSLYGRRYLIVMDDVWDTEVWDQLKFFFPNNNNGSRIMLTTRLLNLVFQLDCSYYIDMGFLNEDNSWNLLCRSVFGEGDCPLELEEIGKKIANNCKGLPLSIVVIGGLLANSEQTQQYWEYIAENLNSVVNLEDNERCLQILYMSYDSLPVYLKPCFLYMGVFLEDSKIRTSELIKLWVAEGILKPIDGESLEEVAEEYLVELVCRNLILVEECNYYGELKSCKVHDLLRDLCLREAQKEKFICVLRVQSLDIAQELNMERRICIDQRRSKKEYLPQVLRALESTPLARSLIWQLGEIDYLPSFDFRLLRVASMENERVINGNECYLEAILQKVNLRYLRHDVIFYPLSRFPSSVSLLWNLQTIIVRNAFIVSAPFEIWNMSQLRHVMFSQLELPNPPSGHMDGRDIIVLENLQRLSWICNFKCSEEVVKKIPNIKKLKLSYELRTSADYCLKDFGDLHQLKFLHIRVHLICDPKNMRSPLVRDLTFPHSLKKLTLQGTIVHWEDLTKIGSLPLLEVLKLKTNSCIGPVWETVEGQFCNLKFLLIDCCDDLEYWMTDETHFPRLERLVLRSLDNLMEIPLSMGDIPTLQSIQLDSCSDSAVDSAKRIQEEQEKLGNEDLIVLCMNTIMKGNWCRWSDLITLINECTALSQ